MHTVWERISLENIKNVCQLILSPFSPFTLVSLQLLLFHIIHFLPISISHQASLGVSCRNVAYGQNVFWKTCTPFPEHTPEWKCCAVWLFEVTWTGCFKTIWVFHFISPCHGVEDEDELQCVHVFLRVRMCVEHDLFRTSTTNGSSIANLLFTLHEDYFRDCNWAQRNPLTDHLATDRDPHWTSERKRRRSEQTPPLRQTAPDLHLNPITVLRFIELHTYSTALFVLMSYYPC